MPLTVLVLIPHRAKPAGQPSEPAGSSRVNDMHHNSTPPASPEVRLEQGEILTFSACPFPLPQADDRAFLFQQQPGARLHKNISYDPASGRVSGFQRHSAEQEARLLGLLADFSSQATRWLAGYLPCYAGGCRPDRATLRPEEEATRKLRQTARNDLLHIDAFPSRPTGGDRILRLFVNLNPTDPRVWLTSHDFAELLARFGPEVGFPDAHPGWARKFSQTVLGLLPGRAAARNAYDRFMLRLHHFL